MISSENELNSLPSVPFNIYFIDEYGSVSPKKFYTVSRKVTTSVPLSLHVYVVELDQYIRYDKRRMMCIAGISVN